MSLIIEDRLKRFRVRKWIAALRSGKYKPGKNKLRCHDGSMCCLGVAFDVACKTTRKGKFKWDDLTAKTDDKNDFSSSYLPMRIKNWFGLPNTDPEIQSRHGFLVPCSYINDTNEYPFTEIADSIERTYIGEVRSTDVPL